MTHGMNATDHARFGRLSVETIGPESACVFALSGPIVSTLNLPNLAWSVAFIPWVMAAAADRTTDDGPPSTDHGPRITPVAIAFALQALCGEPVTWAATALLALAFR